MICTCSPSTIPTPVMTEDWILHAFCEYPALVFRTCHRTTWDIALQWRHTCVLVVYWLYDYSVSSHCTPFRCRAAHENKLEGSIFGLTRYFRWQNFRWPGQLGTSLQIITVSTKRQCLDFRPTCLVGGMDPKKCQGIGIIIPCRMENKR